MTIVPVIDAVVIATVKNRYRSWLNGQPADESLDRWHRIEEFVRIFYTTEKATIMKGWEKGGRWVVDALIYALISRQARFAFFLQTMIWNVQAIYLTARWDKMQKIKIRLIFDEKF